MPRTIGHNGVGCVPLPAHDRAPAKKESVDMACAHFHPGSDDPVSGITRGLCQCDKYNTNPLRPIPPDGDTLCRLPDASGVNCWLDLRACRKAEIAKRFYAYTIGDPYATSAPHVVEVAKDRLGRAFVCLQQRGAWVHEGEHQFPMSLVKS